MSVERPETRQPKVCFLSVLHRRLTLVMVLVLFFPNILSSLFGISGDMLEVHNTVLSFGVVVAVFIFICIVAEMFERFFPDRVLKIVNGLLLYECFVFIPILLIIGQYKNGPIGTIFLSIIFILSLWSMYAVPVVILLTLLFGGGYFYLKTASKK